MKAALWASNQRSQAAEERTTNAMIIPAHLRTLGALLLVSMLWTQTINAATNQAIIRLKRGTVTYLSAAQTANEAKFGKRLEAGSSIQTKGTESTADLFLKQNGPIVRVRPDTELFIQQLDYEEMDKETVVTTRLRLIHGAVRLLVLKLHNLSCYTVYFPGGEMRTSGGEFEISSTGEVTAVTGQLFVQFNQAEKVSAKGYILSSGYSASKDGVRKLNPADSADQSLLISDFIGCIGPPLPAMPLFSEPNFPRRKGL